MVNFFKCIDKISRVLSGCIFLLILLLAVYLQFHYFQKAEEKNVMNLASSWTDENDKPFSLNSFSYAIANEHSPKKIYTTIASTEEEQILLFYSRNMYTNIYLNDILVYEDEPLTDYLYGTSPGIRWHMITVPASEKPITISLENRSVYKNTNGLIDNIYFGTAEEVFQTVITQHFFAFCISVLFILFGLVLCGFFIHFIRKYHTGAEFIYLGTAAVCAGVWSGCESYLPPLLFGNSELFHLISYLCLIALPPAFGLIAMAKLKGKGKITSTIYVLLSCINALITCVLHFGNYVEFHYTLSFTHLLLFAFIPVSFLLLQSYHTQERNIKHDVLHLIGLGLIVFSLLTALIHYYMGTSNDFSFYFRLCVVGFLLCLIIYQMLVLVEMIKNGTRADTLHNLAITDMLTQLYNRTAFQEHRKQYVMPNSDHAKVGIIQFDINNLKKVNDTLGHEKGDQLIKLAAEALSMAFHKTGNCYRMGGDEFLVILTGKKPKSDYKNGMKLLEDFCEKNCILDENQRASIGVEIAHGFVFDPSLTLDEALQLADKKMYKNKKELKKYHQV